MEKILISIFPFFAEGLAGIQSARKKVRTLVDVVQTQREFEVDNQKGL
jgi:hypothetical protein